MSKDRISLPIAAAVVASAIIPVAGVVVTLTFLVRSLRTDAGTMQRWVFGGALLVAVLFTYLTFGTSVE